MSDGDILETLGEGMSFGVGSRVSDKLFSRNDPGAEEMPDISDIVAEAKEAAMEVRSAGAGEVPESAIETAQSQVIATLVAKAHGAGAGRAGDDR